MWKHGAAVFPAPLTRDTMHGFVILDGAVIDIPDVASSSDQFSQGRQEQFSCIRLSRGHHDTDCAQRERRGRSGVTAVEPGGPWKKKNLPCWKTFASQANIAIENTQLVNDMRRTNEVLGTVSDQRAKYIPPQLYQSIIAGEQRAAIEARRKKLTIFFSDIVDFTEITDQLEAEELTALLNEYLSEMSHIAQAHDAYFDKFIGDAMMFYFGDPVSKGIEEDAAACVRMAIEMQNRLETLQDRWRSQGLIDQPFRARIGINTGYCTAGNFGSSERMDYTIIGSEVNLAARLEENADAGGILLAAETYSLVKDWLKVEERDAITMKGFAKPIRTYAVKDIYDEAPQRSSVFSREDEGFSLTIDPDRLSRKSKAELIDVLKAAVTRLE